MQGAMLLCTGVPAIAPDIAWVLAASERAAGAGAVLAEGLVNRLRYLDGTPKGSTRWIDTGWAVVLGSVQK